MARHKIPLPADWNISDEEEDDELQDLSHLDRSKDLILFCVDCSPSMLELRGDPADGSRQTCNLCVALEAAVEIQKKKVMVSPNDQVGILLFNTTRRPDEAEESESTRRQGSGLKKGAYLYQKIAPLDAATIKYLKLLLEDAQSDPDLLRQTFPPLEGRRMAMGDVFTSCNWVLRVGAPKTATKRVFLVTDECDPHAGVQAAHQERLMTSAQTTLMDLAHAGAQVEPFFINTYEKPFDESKFFASVLLPNNCQEDDDVDGPNGLREDISISRIEDLLAEMSFREVPKRAQFSIDFQLAPGLTIGVKGYGLVTEQKKGQYKYFADVGDGMQMATSRTEYVHEASEYGEVGKDAIVYGEAGGDGILSRTVRAGQRPFFNGEEIKKLRSLGMEPGIKLLGFKHKNDLLFGDNIKHSMFIYPDEMAYAGSRRTFSALLKSMIRKNRIGLVLALTRRSSSPMFCALVPQEEEEPDNSGWNDPAGFHLIPLPFADDIRAAAIEEQEITATDELVDLALAWISKLAISSGDYNPDSFRNPALAFHNAQLEAIALNEEFDPELFEDETEPNYDKMHERAGGLLREWKAALSKDESANVVIATTAGTKRKADVPVGEVEIEQRYRDGTLSSLLLESLKAFCRSKSLKVSGKKADLVDRISEWFELH